MDAQGSLRIGSLIGVSPASPQGAGFVICIDGRGRMAESLALKEMAERMLADENRFVVIDLSRCDYLDSTSLGCLLGLHQKHSAAGNARFFVFAPAEVRKKLFGPMRLENMFRFLDDPPRQAGALITAPTAALSDRQFALHVLEAHDRLARHDCPDAAAFERIVQQLERELKSGQPGL